MSPVSNAVPFPVPSGDAAGAATTAGGASALSGPLAASMERLVALAATALRAPLTFIVLNGDDRRCFASGTHEPEWISRDPGALRRSGLIDRITAAPSAIVIRDLQSDALLADAHAAATLEIRSFLGAPIRVQSGDVVGVFCAADSAPTMWSDEDVEMIERFAATAAGDVDLRRTVAEHEALERKLRFDARHDPLTGLANRAVLVDRLRAALSRPRLVAPSVPVVTPSGTLELDAPAEELVAVFFFDVNDFRKINERFGHHVGDQLLVSLGRRLQQMAGADALVARLGGDEFAVLVERVDAADTAEEMAEHFRVVLSQPTVVAGEELPLTVSVGVAMSTTAAELPEHMLRGADLAMARAKRDTRGKTASRAVLFDWKIAGESRSRRRLEDELRRAVRSDEFVLHYMPTISLIDGRITGAEALLRWNHPTRGLLSPFEFLGVAEELDIINEIGRWVLRQACRQVQQWSHDGTDHALSIAVNLSARQFTSSEFLEDVERAIRDFGLAPASLALEVNERVVAHDVSRAAGVLTGLRTLGARIHLDDFGTGNSPLGYLQRLPLDVVKIDHTVVNRMDRDERAHRLVRSVASLARELGLEVIAEGVASAGHLRVLQELGCTHGQGPLFSSAVDAAGVTAMLAHRPW